MRIHLYPDPILKSICAPVKVYDQELVRFVGAMTKVMHSQPGCVGLSAPQVGDLRRIIIVDVTRHKKAVNPHGLLVMINPVLSNIAEVRVMREGCLSIPDYTGNVTRGELCTVKFQDIAGSEYEITAHGIEAQAIQHEADHLDGILFLDRIASIHHDLFPRVSRKRYS